MVLVPSFGAEATLDGRIVKAENLRLQPVAIAFVVQQLPSPSDEAPSGVKSDRKLGHMLLSGRESSPHAEEGIWSVRRAPIPSQPGTGQSSSSATKLKS